MFLFKIIILTGLVVNKSLGTAPSSNPSIIIVGSGPSGIAAATKLLKYNFTNIKVLEAENRIGGRINSVKFGDAYVDLGAEFCHGQQDNIVYEMVKNLNLLRPSTRKYNFLLSNGEIVKKDIGKKVIEFAALLEADDKYIVDCENLKSIGECLPVQSKKILTNIDDPHDKEILAQSPDWVRAYLSRLDCTFDLHDLNIITDYKKCKGDLGLNWNGLGYKTILDVMMQKYSRRLPIDDKIFLRKEVNNIDNWQNGERLTVTTTDGGNYEADHVIFTPSLGVLKANYRTLFNPPLPEDKVDAIKNIGFGASVKVIMHFTERWWKEDASWSLIWTEEDKLKLAEKNLEWLITISSIEQAENNSNVLIARYAGSYIPIMETLSNEQILTGQKHVINTFLAPLFNVKMPDKIIRTSWLSNPHFRGTFSYESVKGHSTGRGKFPDKLAKPLLNQHDRPTVLFAGEATHPYYFSTVHGAIESGYREANRLIDLYSNSS